jgi:hypothetical protein
MELYMPRSRLGVVAGFLLVAVLVFRIWSVLSFAHGKLPFGYDSYSYLTAAQAIAQGTDPVGINLNPYAPKATFQVAEYLYPPLLAVSLIPLAALPIDVGVTLWLGIVALTTIAVIAVLRRWLSWWLAAGAVVLFLPTWESLWLGQINAAIAVLGGLALLEAQNRSARSGVWLALGALIKIMPGVGIAVLVVQRRWRAVGLAAIVGFGCVLLTLPFVSLEMWLHGFVYAARHGQYTDDQVSWTALLRALPGMGQVLGPLLLAGTIVGITLWRARQSDLVMALSAAWIVPLLIGTVIWEEQMIIVLPVLALLWQTSRRGRMLAAATWLSITLIGGWSVPAVLTICWLFCCWSHALSDPQPRTLRTLRTT